MKYRELLAEAKNDDFLKDQFQQVLSLREKDFGNTEQNERDHLGDILRDVENHVLSMYGVALEDFSVYPEEFLNETFE